MTENLVLGLFAGGAALLLAYAGLQLMLALAPSSVPRLDEIGIDATVVLYAAALSLAVGALVGALPALGSGRPDLYGSLRDGRGVTGGRRVQRLRGGLIVLQFAIAMILVFGANLLGRSLLEARAVDTGFETERVVMANLSVEESPRRVPFYDRVLREVGAIPGVGAVGLVEDLFISGAPGRAITVEGREMDETPFEAIRSDAIAGDFFRTMGLDIPQGRAFSAADHVEAPPVAIVNETMARRLWPGASPVGKRFRFGGAESEAPWIEVVGVVGDMRRQGPEREPIPQVFRPYVQEPSRNMNLVVRTSLPASSLTTALRTRVAGIDAGVPVYHVAAVDQALDRYLGQRRFQTLLLGVFSAVAMVLAALGVYGLMQYSVVRRAHELAVRAALGATSRRLEIMVLRYALALAFPGLAAGTLGALWLAGSISALLFGVSPAEWENVLAPAGVLLVTALLAAWLPARRAGRVDPAGVLRAG